MPGRPRPVSRALYEAILAAFRELPGNVSHAARQTRVHRMTARKAWQRGWPDRGFEPCRDVVEREQLAVRARLQTLAVQNSATVAPCQSVAPWDTARAAREDAVLQRTREAEMVRAASRSASELLRVSLTMLKSGPQLSARVEKALGAEEVSLSQARELISAVGRFSRLSVEAAKMVQQMEHRVVGVPDRWVGLHVDMTEEEALREIELGVKLRDRLLAQRAAERGEAVDTEGVGV